MNAQQPTIRQEWWLFGGRCLMPMILVAVRVFAHQGYFPSGVLIVLLVMLLYDLVLLLLLSFGAQSPILSATYSMIDIGLTIASVGTSGPGVIWMGLLPVLAVAGHYGWLFGAAVALIVEAGAVFVTIREIGSIFEISELATLVASALLLPATGALAGALSQDPGILKASRSHAERQQRIVKMAQEWVQVVYQMVEALGVSAQRPARVQRIALDFCIEGLERLGARPSFVGAILLFSEEQNGETILRVSESRGMGPTDEQVAVTNQVGVIGKVLREAEPILTDSPNQDPVLSLFSSFQDCKTVLCLPMRASYNNYGVMIIGSTAAEAFFANEHIELMRAIACQATVALQNAQLYQSLVEERDHIIEVEEATRRQLAHDLHSGPTQGISAVAMRVNYTRRLMEKDPQKAAAELYEVELLAHSTAREIRHMLFTLRPIALESQGMGAALEQLAAKMQDTYEQKVELDTQPGLDDQLDKQTAGAIFYIIEEAINNARKHADADVVRVSMKVQGDVLLVKVEDNGIGFDVEEKIAAASSRSGHLGIIDLQERTELIDGILRIDSTPGKGTSVTLAVPLERVLKDESDTDQLPLPGDDQ